MKPAKIGGFLCFLFSSQQTDADLFVYGMD